MQLTSDTDLAKATAAGTRLIVHKLEVDWALDGQFAHVLSDLTAVAKTIAVERSYAGTLPEETTLVEGFFSAEMTVVLGGVVPGIRRQVTELLSSLRSDSPLYGQAKTQVPIRWSGSFRTKTGTAPMMRQFTGFIVDSRVNKEVTLTCRDGAERLHSELNMPLYMKNAAHPPASTQVRVNSQWVMDYVLRRNGIYQSPPMEPGCIYSATGHGALIPERGHLFSLIGVVGAATEDDQFWVPGRWGIAVAGNSKFGSVWGGRSNGTFTPTPNNTWTIQFQANFDFVPNMRADVDAAGPAFGSSPVAICTSVGSFEALSTTVALRINKSKQLFADFYNGITLVLTVNGPTLTAATGWTDVWCAVDFKGATLNNCTVSFPGQNITGVNLSGLQLSPNTEIGSASVVTTAHFPVQSIQICKDSVFEGRNTLYDPTTWVPQCDLDPGLNDFTSLPIVRGEDSLDVLRELVQTEYGSMGFDESGRFFFKNRKTVRRQGLNVVKTLGPDFELQDLDISERSGSIRNVISTSTVDILGSSVYERVFTLDSITEIEVPPGNSSFFIQLDRPAIPFTGISITASTQAAWDGGDSQAINTFMTCDTNSFAVVISTASFHPDYAALERGLDIVRVDMSVPGIWPVRFSTTTGQVALNYGGVVPDAQAENITFYERQSSIAKYGRQYMPLDSNRWRQLSRPMQAIALMLLKDLKAPLPIIERIPVRGDFRTQLNDVMKLDDHDGLGGPVTVAISGLRRELSGNKLTDNLTIRTIASPGKWILGHPELSILGITTVLG